MICKHKVNLKTIGGARTIPVIDGKIKWHFDEQYLPSNIDKYKAIVAFQKCFNLLQNEFNPIIFESTGVKEEAPIIIKFASNALGNAPEKFDKGVLAFAYGNYQNFEYASDLFINLDYSWLDMYKPGQIYLQKVVVHELLHCLGFDHSNDSKDVMFWQYQENENITFTEDTKKSIREFYKLAPIVNVPEAPKIIKYDAIEVLREWVKNSVGYVQINERSLISLAKQIGLTLSPLQALKVNQTIFKKYLGL